jgi:hypothetical protein
VVVVPARQRLALQTAPLALVQRSLAQLASQAPPLPRLRALAERHLRSARTLP